MPVPFPVPLALSCAPLCTKLGPAGPEWASVYLWQALRRLASIQGGAAGVGDVAEEALEALLAHQGGPQGLHILGPPLGVRQGVVGGRVGSWPVAVEVGQLAGGRMAVQQLVIRLQGGLVRVQGTQDGLFAVQGPGRPEQGGGAGLAHPL